MHGMQKFCTVACALALCATVALSAYGYSNHDSAFYAWSLIAVIISYVACYGSGFFAGWIAQHEENRSVYRHEN